MRLVSVHHNKQLPNFVSTMTTSPLDRRVLRFMEASSETFMTPLEIAQGALTADATAAQITPILEELYKKNLVIKFGLTPGKSTWRIADKTDTVAETKKEVVATEHKQTAVEELKSVLQGFERKHQVITSDPAVRRECRRLLEIYMAHWAPPPAARFLVDSAGSVDTLYCKTCKINVMTKEGMQEHLQGTS